jgi:hypothetical protein
MPGKGSVVGTVVKYGVKYGPHLAAAIAVAKEPAKEAASTYLAARTQQRLAAEHAATLVEGRVLKVMHGGRTHWVVFSGDEAVTSYPTATTALADLLARADLTKRIRPEDLASLARVRRRLGPRRRGPQ